MEDKKEIPQVDQFEIFAIKLYQKKGDLVLCSSIVVKSIYWLYEKLVKKNEVPSIELLPIQEKNKYWLIAKQYYTDQTQAIMASKAAYILTVITTE